MNVAQEITQLLGNRAASIAAHDVDGVMEQIAPDIVSFDVGKPLAQTGAEAVRERLKAWFSAYDGRIGFAVRDLAVYGEGNVAFSHALVHVSGRLKAGTSVSMWVRSTIGWVRGERG